MQYATLKAMGYRSLYLFSTVIQEEVILAVLGYIPGLPFPRFYELTLRATQWRSSYQHGVRTRYLRAAVDCLMYCLRHFRSK